MRQYDAEGTAELFAYFGDVAYKYGLDEAIGNCLVPYDYYVHPIELTEDELARWSELTERIARRYWRQEEGAKPDEYIQKLLRDRRAVLENAANKIDALEKMLANETRDSISHTLIYTSDKDPAQMKRVNELLNAHNIRFHQLTADETADRKQTSGILSDFQSGMLSVLTAKRVLDEGVNIPQVRKAYILASTTVERQWTQRRGRLLRKCDAIGKTHSEIHDFAALPPSNRISANEDRAIFRSELQRVREFAGLARNAAAPGGPLATLDLLIEGAYL